MRLSTKSLVNTSILLAVLLFAAAPSVVHAQGIDRMVFTTFSGGPQKVWDTDTVEIKLEGSLLTIIGHMPTGDATHPVQLMTLKVRNFNGSTTFPKTYNLVGSDAIWQNFAGRTGYCNGTGGTLTITKIDPDNRLHASFEFYCETEFASGSKVTTQVYTGVVSGIIPIQLKVKVKPGEKFSAKPEEDVTVSLTVVNSATDAPVTGARVICKDNPILIKFEVEVGVTGATGEVKYTFKIPKSLTEKKDYTLVFYATKEKAKDSPTANQIIEVEPNERYWYYKCAGINVIEYDAGEGETWEKLGEDSPIKKASGSKVMVNRFLKWEGSSFQIDTTPGAERVFYDGKLMCPDCQNVDLAGGAFLESEAFALTTAGGNCEGIMKLAASKQTGLKFMGVALKLDTIAFLPEWNDPGIKIRVILETEVGNDLRQQCAKSNDPEHRSIGIGFVWRKSGLQKVEFQASNIGVGKAFCFNELAASYDNAIKTLSASARVTFEEVIDKTAEIKTSIVLRSDTTKTNPNTYLKDYMLQVTGEANCYPVPPQPEFCFKGFRVNAGFDTEKGVRKWNFGLTGIFKLTAEAVASGKFKWIEKWGTTLGADKPELCEFELTGKWEYPAKFSGKGLIKLAKIPYISVTKPWQSTLDATIALDFVQGITGRGNVKIGHLGADDFFASLTDVGFNMVFNPYDFSLQGSGALRIPAIGDELNEQGAANFLKWLKAFNVSNITLGQGSVYLGINEKDGFAFKLVCDVSKNPVSIIRSYGKMFIDLKANSADGLYLNWGDAYAQLAVKRETDPIQRTERGITSKSGPQIQAAPLDTFTVTSSIERVFILVNGASTAPVSTLISPSGTSYTETTTDSSIIKFQADDNSMTQWVLVEPEDGDWKIQLSNPSPLDEVSITAKYKERPFDFQANVSGRTLTLTWDGAGYSSEDRIAFVLDVDQQNFDGITLGSADAATGTHTYVMSDTLPLCEYYVGATRVAKGLDILTVYAPNTISTGKTILAPPTNVQATTSGVTGLTKISWTPSVDPNVASYVIYVDAGDVDTVLFYAERYETEIVVATAGLDSRDITIVAVNDNNLRGCPSQPVQTVTSVDEDIIASHAGERTLFVVPNPAEMNATLFFRSSTPTEVQFRIINVMGQEIAHYSAIPPTDGFVIQPIDVSTMQTGMYYICAMSGAMNETVSLVVSR